MKRLLYYIPHRLINSRAVSNLDPINVSFLRMFNGWISLSDRTGTLDIPGIPVHNNSPIPAAGDVITFEACSFQRMDRIIRDFENSDKKNLILLYSGGIDSTLIACLLIAHPAWSRIRDRVRLACNEDSQIENPLFFRQMILKHFGDVLISSNDFYDIVSNPSNACITGECADNLFGSLTLKSYMDSTLDYGCIHEPWQSGSLNWLLDKTDRYRDQREEMLYRLVAASPVAIESNHDFLWWLNFAMKWQAVKYRMSMHAPTAEQAVAMAANVINFFDTEDYQRWALYTQEQKVGDIWSSYKMPAKKLIYDIWPDKSYLAHKTKWPSLPTITRYNNAWGYLWEDESGQLSVAKQI